jgi:transposase
MPRGTQIIKGTEYVFDSDSKWNADKQYGTHKRTYIGKMVDGVFVPNAKYQLREALEEAKTRRQSGSVPVSASSRLFCGATALLDAIGEKLGITGDLKACFPNSWKQILSLAYFLILEDRNPLSRFTRWASNHRHPFGENIPSQRSSELFGSIGEDAKQRFFLAQTRRRMETEYLAYDTTSISSYSTMIKQVRYGKNKDHDRLPQINLALLFGQDSRLPVYYRKLPGNISDVSTVKKLLADIAFLSFDKVKLVMDRGFYSEDNINALYQHHFKFLIAVKKSLSLVQTVLDEVRESMLSRASYDSVFKINYHSRTVDWSYRETKKRSGKVETGERRLYLHLYYNGQKAFDDKDAFNTLLDSLEEELRSNRRDPEHEKLYRKYYEVSTTPVRGVSITARQDAIDLAERDYGYFALISNDIKDPIEALKLYRSKDLIEKAFGNLKERLNMRRTSVSSEQNLEGKLFVQFIALMYLSYITAAMNEKGMFKDYTIHEILDDLDVIECFEQPGHAATIGEITKKQKGLYASLGVAVPV